MTEANACEFCMTIEDIADLSAGRLYVTALGFDFKPKPFVAYVDTITESKLKKHQSGVYELHVIDSEKLPPNQTKSENLEALARMCSKYGRISIVTLDTNLLHDQRLGLSRVMASELLQMPSVKEVYLTGSTATNSDRPDSDLDLLVIMGTCPGESVHGEIEGLRNSRNFPMDFFYVLQGDLAKVKTLGYPLVSNAVRLLPLATGQLGVAQPNG